MKDYARVADCIIGWGSSVGRWARVENKAVIGEDVHVKARGSRVWGGVKVGCAPRGRGRKPVMLATARPLNHHRPIPPRSLQDEVLLNGTIVLPHKELKESQLEPGTIVR